METPLEELKTKPLTKAKLWEMSLVIINALKTSKRLSDNPEPNWKELEGDWFDWLEEELVDYPDDLEKNKS